MSSLLILLTAVCWSTAGVFVKNLTWSAFSVASFRGLIGVIVLGIYRAFRKKEGIKGVLPQFSRENLLIGVSVFSLSTCYMLAIRLTTAANAIVLQYTAPILVLLYHIFILKVKPQKTDLILTFVIFFGCALAFAGELEAGGLWGNLIALISGFALAGQLIFSKNEKANPLDGAMLGCLLSFIVFLPFLLQEKAEAFTPNQLLFAVLLGVFQYGMAYICYSEGAPRTPALQTSLLLTLEPVLSPVWVYIFLGEKPSTLSLCGLVCVILALWAQAFINHKKANA